MGSAFSHAGRSPLSSPGTLQGHWHERGEEGTGLAACLDKGSFTHSRFHLQRQRELLLRASWEHKSGMTTAHLPSGQKGTAPPRARAHGANQNILRAVMDQDGWEWGVLSFAGHEFSIPKSL